MSVIADVRPSQLSARAGEGAASVGISTAFVGRCEEAPKALAEAPEPLAIVVQMDAEGAAQLFAHVRGQARLVQLPIFGVVPRREDLAFTELFSWGGDDLLALASAPSFARCLRPLIAHLPNRERQQTSPERCAIVGGADARWRSVMGRALYQGGFSVRFVASADDLHQESLAASVALLVLADDLGPGQVEAALRAARAHGSQVAWIVVTPSRRGSSGRLKLAALEARPHGGGWGLDAPRQRDACSLLSLLRGVRCRSRRVDRRRTSPR